MPLPGASAAPARARPAGRAELPLPPSGGHGAPASHAASAPTTTATDTTYQSIAVFGSGFTSGGRVFVDVFDSSGNYAGSQWTTATMGYCGPRYCLRGGFINITVGVSACWQYDTVAAFDANTGTFSNVVNVYVDCLA